MKTKKISINKLFIFTGVFFLFFVFISNIINNIYLSFVFLAILIFIFINFYVYTKKYLVFLLFIIIGSILGIFFSYFSNQNIENKLKSLEPFYNNKYITTGKITGVNKIKDYESEYKIRLLKLCVNSNCKNLFNKNIEANNIEGLITIPSNFKIKKGNIIKFSEKLNKIENFDTNFNYEKFSYSKNIFFKINAGSINVIGKNKQNFIVNKIYNVRQIFLDKINKLYTKEEGVFLGGILLGARESMPNDLKTDFNNSGLTHFIAVSGFNITILIIFLSLFLKIFPAFLRIIFITLSIGAFVILVGDSVSVIRASIMGLVGYYIAVSGRVGNNLAIIIFVAIIMVFISPLSINYDVSLHLSFLAVLGILYTQKYFTKIFFFLPDFMSIKEAFVLTLSAMSFALPIILFNFGQISFLSPFANMAVTWTIPLAMLGGFVSICVDFVYHTLAVWISYFTWVLLAWDIKIVHFFGGQDWAIIKTNLGVYKYSLEILYFVILLFLINLRKED